ncbi:hypothetical protein BDV59DRAFT_194246 [Aspergillus ambiguus]|uniref:putative C6 transcription factor n=1 Tax=Aspergillus ambiguus TaxID=176160 RepID=UPI003CCE2E30
MSGSVSAEDQLETSGTARRPGHPELPQPVTTADASLAVTSTAASAGVPGPVLATQSPVTTSSQAPLSHHVASTPGDELSRPLVTGSDTFPPRYPPTLVGPGAPQISTSTFSQPPFGTSPPVASTRTLPQRGTRRTKAHVASACVNCKKKHLGCDPARPCRRCVLSGKEATCVDVTHKKRGRPPLKAEEASMRAFASQVDTRGVPGEQQGTQLRRSMHRATSSRELRPMTDLQMPGGTAGALGLRAAPTQPHRWPPAYSAVVDPALSMPRSMGHRRFSSSGSIQSLTAASPPTFIPMTTAFNPTLGAGRMPPGMGRPISSYPGQALQPSTSPPQYQQSFGIPVSSYQESTRMPNRLSIGEAPTRDARESFMESPVRLPPIYPPPMTTPGSSPHGHRLSDPYPTLWSPRTREQFLQQDQRHQAPSQGLMPPISPSSHMRQSMGEFSYGEPASRPLPPVSEATPRHLSMSSLHGRDEPSSEVDTGDSRPAKRQKMALDDMVND